MRLPTPPSSTIMALAAAFDKVFEGVDFAFFVSFMTVFCQGQGARTITQAQQTAAFERDYSRFWQFVDSAEFELDEVFDIQLEQLNAHGIKTELGDGRRAVVGCIDDTLNRRPYGPKLFGTQTHHDHAAKSHQSTYALGQRQVMMGLVPDALDAAGARCFLLDSELYVSQEQATEAGKDTMPFETRHQLAGLMTHRLGQKLDDDELFYVLCDAWYTKVPLLKWTLKRDKTHLLGRLQKNRVLYQLPEPKEPGTPGRPPKYGPRWDWTKALTEEGKEVEQVHYGQKRRLKYVSKVVKLNGFEPEVLVVAAQYTDVNHSKPVLFLCTDGQLEPETVIRLYCARFSEEEAFKDFRQVVGWGTERVRSRRRWRRYERLLLLAFCWLRMIAESQPQAVHEQVRDGWRKEQPRLTLGQVQQGLRYESWRQERVFRDCRAAPEPAKTLAAYERAVNPRPKPRTRPRRRRLDVG